MFNDSDNTVQTESASVDTPAALPAENKPLNTPSTHIRSFNERNYGNRNSKNKKKNKKICILCKRGFLMINYKDTELLSNYIKKYNKILTHKISGNCIKHQHQLSNAIKRARYIGILPFVCD